MADPAVPPARGDLRLALFVLALFAVFDAAVLTSVAATLPQLYPDFFGTWSFARYVATNPPATIYDQPRLHEFQRALAPGLPEFFPFAYPPSFMLLLAPLAPLSFAAAYLAWIAPAALAYLTLGARLLSWAVSARVALAALALLPASTLTLVYGQSGFLTAALLLAALALLPARPLAAGVCIGLLTVKPQLGLLLPLALMALGAWRALAAAALTALALAAASALAFGAETWPSWLAGMALHAQGSADAGAKYTAIMATPLAAFTRLGAPRALALAGQAAASLFAALTLWRACRAGLTPRAMVLLLLGGIVATPYAFVYDTPAAMAGTLLHLLHARRAAGGIGRVDLVLGIAVLLGPAFVFAAAPAPVLPLALLALYVRVALAPSGSPA